MEVFSKTIQIFRFFFGFTRWGEVQVEQIWVVMYKTQPSPCPNANPNPKTIPIPNTYPTPNPE